ncbi:MAG: flagellar basal body P-ring formation chaperone FlgA [Thermodesulfobacteriota bacterium]
MAFWLLFGSALPAAAEAVQVTFLPEATVQGETLHLQDVARITPESAAQKWGEVRLFQVPDYGSVRTYRTSTLKAYVLQQTAAQGQKFEWDGAEHVNVRREGQLVSQEKMVELVQDFIQKQLDRPELASVSFEASQVPQPFTLPNEQWKCEVVPSSSQILSARRFTLLFRQQGRLVQKSTVTGRVKAEAEVVTARRDVDRGHVLQSGDLRVQGQRLSRLDDPVFESSAAVGKRVTRSVRSGQVLDRSILAAPILVNRGNPVTLEAVKGPLTITAKGVAQEDGGLQDTIRVENARSGKEVFGTVVGKDTVRVNF